jgi:hypothetical protein
MSWTKRYIGICGSFGVGASLTYSPAQKEMGFHFLLTVRCGNITGWYSFVKEVVPVPQE